MAACRRACGHREIVEEYRAARINDELQRENETRGFATEMDEYPTLISFGAYLRMRRQ
jgi:hypothetical protein